MSRFLGLADPALVPTGRSAPPQDRRGGQRHQRPQGPEGSRRSQRRWARARQRFPSAARAPALAPAFRGEFFLPPSCPFVSHTTRSPVTGKNGLFQDILGSLGCVVGTESELALVRGCPVPDTPQRRRVCQSRQPQGLPDPCPEWPRVCKSHLGEVPWMGQGFKKPDHRASLFFSPGIILWFYVTASC